MKFPILFLLIFACVSPSNQGSREASGKENNLSNEYTGTAAITQGFATAISDNLYPAGQRITRIGTITARDSSTWIVPAEVNYENSAFPFASDLYNPDGTKHASAAQALEAFDDEEIIEIDADGEVITGYIFGDNYFELYINGAMVGKDAIPFTQFNSHIVKFKVAAPYTIAMLLVDWEENLGLGSEANRRSKYHAGDGGIVVVFKDASGNTVCTTGSEWKAQTFYTSPIKDLACVSESGATRNSSDCNTDDVSDGSNFYGLHWQVPTDWMKEDFDDFAWPSATTYTNETIGVDNKASYTNFTDIFDHATDDAQFIWSSNVILDNEVIVRYTVK